ncbi:phage tail sheath family protein [Paenibacillus macquariensis]|uniref:Phage tail protein n=1 Tax=Paenibacillus macquariensis TaxID=948756 RepID=A0ABY1K707_9BACL|nr:phage tail protein [Paenibacillus macquariensis]MEC0092500.1 phage tail sheath family protein [Paenibacillus macquariensis]OAB35458.1 phage tail protein [Paenibacillus macquariensis subsp. macquariensis]SIR35329.1 hypothetical protein SAMN05421578_111166 [Paenibacillus macquariensis]
MSIEVHGVKATEVAYKPSSPTPQAFTLPVVFGTAPVNLTQSTKSVVNVPIKCNNMNEFKYYFGYSDDWEQFTLCEFAYSHFELYGQSPVVFVNVLDPSTDAKITAPAAVNLTSGIHTMPEGVIKGSVTVASQDGTTTHVLNTDYTLTYGDDGELILAVVSGGGILTGTTSLKVGFSSLDPSVITSSDIIGGSNSTTGVRTGLELMEEVFPRYQLIPGLIVAPGYSSDPVVAAVMVAKSQNINGLFEAFAITDMDASERYIELVDWKEENHYTSPLQMNTYPKAQYKGKTYHMSTLAAGTICATDAANDGVPYQSPSNQTLMADALIMEDGSEAYIPLDQAQYVNANGIVTAINFSDGYKLFGNRTGAYPKVTDPQRAFTSVRRMFGWIKNNLVLNYWRNLDAPMNNRLIDFINDNSNVWMNGLTSAQYILGGRVEFNATENPSANLMDGKIVFHVYVTPPSPAQEIEFLVEYDVAYIAALTA